MKLAAFTAYTAEHEDSHTVYVNPEEVAAVRAWRWHSFREAIGEIVLKSGEKIRVWQNCETVAKRLNEVKQ